MGRKRNEETNYKVTVHKVRNYYYARLQQSYQDKKTGKTKRKDIVLGTLDSKGKFFPGEKYWELPEDERTKLIFPDYWNWSETENSQMIITSCYMEIFGCLNKLQMLRE